MRTAEIFRCAGIEDVLRRSVKAQYDQDTGICAARSLAGFRSSNMSVRAEPRTPHWPAGDTWHDLADPDASKRDPGLAVLRPRPRRPVANRDGHL
jgi:hypothetical protein